MAHKIWSSLLVGAAIVALSSSAQARDGYDAMEDQLLQNGSTGTQPQGFGPGPARDGWRAHDRHHDEGRWGHHRWYEDAWDPDEDEWDEDEWEPDEDEWDEDEWEPDEDEPDEDEDEWGDEWTMRLDAGPTQLVAHCGRGGWNRGGGWHHGGWCHDDARYYERAPRSGDTWERPYSPRRYYYEDEWS